MTSEVMAGFGYKMGWLAIRDGVEAEVLHALGAQNLGPIGWREGVGKAYQDKDVVVATPPLAGADCHEWLLVTGWWLASGIDDVIGLSAVLDREVQYFFTYRVSDVHIWERAISGTAIRSFAYEGDRDVVTRWRGEPSPIERAVGLPVTVDLDVSAFENHVRVDEADVMRVAGAWSVDPTSLDGQPAPGTLTIARVPNDNRVERTPRRWPWSSRRQKR